MDYVSKLSLEEQKLICMIMGGTCFKDLFIKGPRDFNKIKPGFRANKLTDTQALDIAVENFSKYKIVYQSVNIWLTSVIKQINECMNDYEYSGKSHDEALTMTLVDSYFVNHIELYFKLLEEDISEEKLQYIKQEIEKIQKKRSDVIIDNNKITILEQRIEELENELKKANADYRRIFEDKKREVSDCENKISTLNSTIADLLEQLQYAKAKIEIDSSIISDEQQLLQNEDKAPKGLPKRYSEEIVSLCKISTDYIGNIWLIRFADIDYNGSLSKFHIDENRTLMFDNRNKLFYKDGLAENGLYAIWDWTAIPNINDPKKDYVTTKFNPHIVPIEIIKLIECDSIESAIETIKNGYEFKAHSKRIMFVISNEKRIYEGILCQEKEINNNRGVLSLSDSVIQLPVYEFRMDDMVINDDETIFFRKVYAGVPSRLYRVKNHIDIVKNIVFDSISWSNYKTRGIARAEYKCFKDIISSISSDDIIKKIASTCNCNIKLATELLEQFISKISIYLNEESLEDAVIESALNNNDALLNRAKSLIMADWKAENTKLIKEAESELKEVIEMKKTASSELEQIKADCTKFKEEAESFSATLAEKEKLASDVETAIENKIKSAQLKAADFIANMAFIFPSISQSVPSEKYISTASFEIVELPFIKNEADEHHNWKEIIETLDFELGEAGVCSEYSLGLATFLCASYIAKEPLFLIGPNSDSIAEAFTISLFGCDLGVLNCQGDYSKSFLLNSDYYDHPVVMVKNIISSRWIEYLPELLADSNQNPYCFLTHPYAEDIQVEPKSLYNYVLPLFTEFFVNCRTNKDYCGGYFSDNFQDYAVPAPEKYRDVMKLSANKLVKTRLNQILTIMHSINKNLSKEDDFIYGVLQYAYATLDNESIKAVLNYNESAISNQLEKDLKCMLGEVE